MQYQVLARKWRPKNFHELVGQEHVSRTLLNALQQGRVAHAFLFSGPRGSGKTSTARILAKALNCHRGTPGEPCNTCPACVEIAAGNCMDVLEIDAASNRGIDEIRELKEKTRYNPARDKNKIFIIDEVHMLTPEAFNALLKTLEEPPPHVVFILATTEYHKIPATILSRCQQHSFKLIQYPLIMKRLREISETEGIQISTVALEQVVFSSGGSMRDAMSALDQVIAFSGASVRDEDVAMLLGLVEPKVLGQTIRAIAGNDVAALLQIVADLVEVGQDLNNFCRRLSGQFRNLMVLKAGITDPALLGIPESILPDLREQAGLFSREDLLRLFDAFLKIEAGMRYATQIRFQLEMGLIELAHMTKLRPIEDLIAELSADEEGNPPRNPEGSARSAAAKPETPPARPNPSRWGAKPPPSETKNVISAPKHEQKISSSAPAAESSEQAPPVADPRNLLFRIAGAVGRESLESLMQSLEGAQLKDNLVILLPGTANEFTRRQIKNSLADITQAATRIVGSSVKVMLAEPESKVIANTVSEQNNRSDDGDLLEAAKREPIVKSFLDVFPGPVKAEKIDK
ncbi:MAG: DNA polymerase III subunit gamma/tau [Acidobacteria bacterium]|nr:DNA polymerase III subunit gamma/tau [Acidobacteriota bacterium]